MPRCLTLAPHRPDEALERRYRQSRDPVARPHWQMLWLVAQGHTCPAVATVLGSSKEGVRTIVHRSNADGPTGSGDRRHGNPGQTPRLSPALDQVLATHPPDGALWTSPTVAAWMTTRWVTPSPSGEPGRRCGRCASRSSSPGSAPLPPIPPSRRRSKRGLQSAVDAVQAAHPDASVAIWAEDEHRLGLLPTVTLAAMQVALAEFARDEEIDATHRAILVGDGAGWHTSPARMVSDGIALVPLPPASPELQSAERLWPLVHAPVANRTCADLGALAAVLVTRGQTARANRNTISALTHSWWWPSEHPLVTHD